MIHCKKYKCFKSFGELVSDERRKGDEDEDYKIIGDEMKNIGNSGYGRTSMNKSKHTSTKYETLAELKKNQSIRIILKTQSNLETDMKYKKERK